MTHKRSRRPSTLLDTDGYKFSMAEAGYPLRTERFYYSQRRGGWSFLPVDVAALVREELPAVTEADWDYLAAHGYRMGGAARAAWAGPALAEQITVESLPRGAWFHDREPVFTVSGPSFVVSWLEPALLRINRRIQIATLALTEPARLQEWVGTATCEEERDLTLATLDSVGVRPEFPIEVATQRYRDDVRRRAQRMVEVVGDPSRLFEVGMRTTSCPEQHRIAVSALLDAGLRKTSDVGLARELGATPVGTMGHEHVQRHGGDARAFSAMRDRFPGFVYYLPDTFDTIGSGVPAALAAMAESPGRPAGIRFDSETGIRGHYLYAVCRARELGLEPTLGLESGWNLDLTVEFEALRATVGWPAEKQGYGVGNFLVKPEWAHLGRDRVSAVYKLCDSGGRPVMKFGDEPGRGKESIPGHPVLWRPHLGMAGYDGPLGFVAQAGEDWRPPIEASLLTGAAEVPGAIRFTAESLREIRTAARGLAYSPATTALVDAARARRRAARGSISGEAE
jgi:nicotinic acid phosphoribosyltransferase